MPNVEPLSREELGEFEPFFQFAERAMGFVLAAKATSENQS